MVRSGTAGWRSPRRRRRKWTTSWHKQRARAIVIAHTVATGGRIAPRFDGRVFQIDTGMQPAYVPTGAASALEISRGVFTAIYEDRRDVLVAAPADPSEAAASRH